MEINNKLTLNPKEELAIVELVKEERRRLDLGMGPLGERFFSVFREYHIQILFFAMQMERKDSLEALYLEKKYKESGERSCYIAINTSVPYDLQIFNACHEYYHHIDELDDNIHLKRSGQPDGNKLQAKANRFAAEFLLPTETLETQVKKQNKGNLIINQWSIQAMLRFIAQLHIDYQAPYRTIVKRLFEVGAIAEGILENLLIMNDRDPEGLYFKIGMTLNPALFKLLNEATQKNEVEPEALEAILQNYDENLITVDVAAKDLSIFNYNLEDFGYDIGIDQEDLDEIFELLGDDD